MLLIGVSALLQCGDHLPCLESGNFSQNERLASTSSYLNVLLNKASLLALIVYKTFDKSVNGCANDWKSIRISSSGSVQMS